ncbi:WhiB family transcriptional regulator [Micromonospora sp. NPDC047762]|uniref:WhiB family transcriptional regulator n=1 Tax=Micromonospora sp. NPDC047762 TaxID=3364255 RepID=UPI003719E426
MTLPIAEWRTFANCQGLNDAMYPEWGDKVGERDAKRVCSECPVKQQCLKEALALRDYWGIQGELNGRERRQIVEGDEGRECARCGQNYIPRIKNQKNCYGCAQALDGHHYGAKRRACTTCGANAHVDDDTGKLGRHKVAGKGNARPMCRGEDAAPLEVAA